MSIQGIAVRARTAAWLLCLVPLGFACKFYRGPAADWVNNSLSGVFYVLFWCLAFFLFRPQGKPSRIAAFVLLATSLLEVGQLWHPPFLERIRGWFLGRALLGTTFVWSDFLYYIIGCGLGWLWMRRLAGRRRAGSRAE